MHHLKTSYGGHTCLLIMSEVATVTKGGGAYRRLWKGLLQKMFVMLTLILTLISKNVIHYDFIIFKYYFKQLDNSY